MVKQPAGTVYSRAVEGSKFVEMQPMSNQYSVPQGDLCLEFFLLAADSIWSIIADQLD